MATSKKRIVTHGPLEDTPASYRITLTLGDKVYTSSASDVTDAILALKPEKISTRAVVSLDHDSKHSEFLRTVPQIRRVFTNRLSALILGRNLVARLR